MRQVDDKNKHRQKKYRKGNVFVPGVVEKVGVPRWIGKFLAGDDIWTWSPVTLLLLVGYKCPQVQSIVSSFVNRMTLGESGASPTMCRLWEGRWLRFPEASQGRGDMDREIILIGFHKDHLAVAELRGKIVMSWGWRNSRESRNSAKAGREKLTANRQNKMMFAKRLKE